MSSYYRTLLMEQVIDGAYYVNLIIAYANSQGWTIPSSGTITAMITLVDSMLSSGIWDKYDIFYNFGYNDTNLRNFSRINWKSPGSFNISYNSTTLPNYTINGFEQTTGSSGTYTCALNTNFIPSTNGVNYTLNNASITKYLSGTPGGIVAFFKVYTDSLSTSEGMFLTATKTGQIVYYEKRLNGGQILTPGGISYFGYDSLTTINRVDSSTVNHYISGSLVQSVSSLSTSLSNDSFILLSDDFLTTKYTFNMFGVGGEMNSTDNSNMNTYYSTFKTSLGL